MWQGGKPMANEHQKQPYDNVLKMVLEGQQAALLPQLLNEDVVFLEELNVEVMNPPLRVDRVYKAQYRGQPHVLHFEFESGPTSRMDVRLLVYHAYFLYKYGLPVISIIVYPFETTMVESPLRESSRHEELLTFHFRRLSLWGLDARKYVKDRVISMYALLPTMQGASLEVLHQAIEEMIQYHKSDDVKLARQLLCFGILMRRANLLPPEDKYQLEERLRMYNSLIDEDPYIQERDALAEARGEVRGEIKALQRAVVTVVKGRFPQLVELAQQQVANIDKPDALDLLVEQVTTAPSEDVARWLLQTLRV
jgi:hypothetical protein